MSKELLQITLSNGSTLVIQQEDLKYVIDNGTERECFICDKLETSSETLTVLRARFNLTDSLDLLNRSDQLSANPQAVENLIEQDTNEVWVLFDCGETVVINDTIDNVRNAFNATREGNNTVVSADYTVDNSIDIVFVDTANVTITIPADRKSILSVVNESNGDITLDPLTNTIVGEDDAIIGSGSTFTIALNTTTNDWRLI